MAQEIYATQFIRAILRCCASHESLRLAGFFRFNHRLPNFRIRPDLFIDGAFSRVRAAVGCQARCGPPARSHWGAPVPGDEPSPARPNWR